MGDRTAIGRGRGPSGHLLSTVRGLLAALLQGPHDDGQRQLQRLAPRGRLARQVAREANAHIGGSRLPQEAESTEAVETCYACFCGPSRTDRSESEARRSCWFDCRFDVCRNEPRAGRVTELGRRRWALMWCGVSA